MSAGFMYIGANGVYTINGTTDQNIGVNTSNAYTGTTTATTTYGALSGLLGGVSYGGVQNQLGAIAQQYVAPPVHAAKKKIKGVLANLRAEIDGWHGDVLDRCPA